MHLRFLLIALVLAATALAAKADNLFQNANFKNGTSGWHGDAKVVYLKPDGTEGDEHDPGAVPVMRITLSKRPHSVYQNLRGKDVPGKLNISLEVFASPDFKRSTHADDYADDFVNMPVTDFVVRLMPDWWSHEQNLKAGEWTKVSEGWSSSQAFDERSIYFLIPPGEGFIYIRNPSITP